LGGHRRPSVPYASICQSTAPAPQRGTAVHARAPFAVSAQCAATRCELFWLRGGVVAACVRFQALHPLSGLIGAPLPPTLMQVFVPGGWWRRGGSGNLLRNSARIRGGTATQVWVWWMPVLDPSPILHCLLFIVPLLPLTPLASFLGAGGGGGAEAEICCATVRAQAMRPATTHGCGTCLCQFAGSSSAIYCLLAPLLSPPPCLVE